MRTLVVFYSRTGNTRAVAREIAGALDARIDEIRAPGFGPGVGGALRALLLALRGRPASIEGLRYDPAEFDLVVVGGPVWAAHMAAPVGTYLRERRAALSRVAFFLTFKGQDADPAFKEMAEAAGQKPLQSASIRAAEIKRGQTAGAIKGFLARLERQAAPDTST